MKLLFLFILYISLTCCNINKQHSLSYLEMEEKSEKEKRIEEEAYQKSLKIKRVKMDSLMKDNITIIGDLKLGMSKSDCKRIINNIGDQYGSVEVKYGDVSLTLSNTEYYKGKLYSVSFTTDYLYGAYKSDYNSNPEYHPYPYFEDVVSHFENKYGKADYKNTYTGYTHETQKADNFYICWIFSKKRIGISNVVEMYGGENDYAPYVLTITIDDYKIANMIKEEKERRDSIDKVKQEQIEAREKKRIYNISRTI